MVLTMVTIRDVVPGSPAALKHVKAGDVLLSINGHEIRDVLDYRFYMTDSRLELLLHRGPELLRIAVRKEMYDDLGLEFDTFLMDCKRSCKNKCLFCFIDQLPPGLRETLYFKDDDSRLSFLMGNYVTLTNMEDGDVERILRMHLSPVRVSVHTTNPDLRVSMMKNPRAGKVLSYLKQFAEAGILMDCQIVLCKGVNDGEELERTMRDLSLLHPAVESVSVVPAGITKYREGLPLLKPFSSEEAAAVIRQVEAFAQRCLAELGSRIFFLGDEFYLKARLPLPAEESYEGFPQLENGVGMLTNFRCEFEDALRDAEAYDTAKARSLSVATGTAAGETIREMVEMLTKTCYNTTCRVYEVENSFFGEHITVAGLITGRDLTQALRGRPLGERLLIPAVMLRREGDLFLDGMSLADVERELKVPVVAVQTDGASLVRALLY